MFLKRFLGNVSETYLFDVRISDFSVFWECHFLVAAVAAAAAATSHPPQYHPSISVNNPISSPQVKPTITSSLIHSLPSQEALVPALELKEPPLSLLGFQYTGNSRTMNEVIRYWNASYQDTLPKRFLSTLFPKQEIPLRFRNKKYSYVSETRWMSVVSETIHTNHTFEMHTITTFP